MYTMYFLNKNYRNKRIKKFYTTNKNGQNIKY